MGRRFEGEEFWTDKPSGENTNRTIRSNFADVAGGVIMARDKQVPSLVNPPRGKREKPGRHG
jgi:hypothetical protein